MVKKPIPDNINDMLNDMAIVCREKNITHLYTEDETYNGRTIKIKGKDLLNFGSCSYLGLDMDERIKEGAIDAIQRYGVQFSSSRAFVSCTLYKEWEKLIQRMFNAPVVLTTSVSLGHHAVIPVVVEPSDVIIMDQQVHASVQDACLKMQVRGVAVEIIRHNQLDELEKKIKELIPRYKKIWYMIDGVYSMYGDFAPMKELIQLLNRYQQLYLYADDAHGMSIAGPNGTGVIMSQVKLHKKMVLATSLNKAFAAGGGAFIFSNEDLCQKVRYFGGPMIFSGPHQVPVIGAGIASAKIHLSSEIYERQASLKKKLNYCHQLLEKYGLPIVSNPDSPISFIGLGLARVGYNLVKKMMDAGFFVNLAIFPAVPETCSGLRFTITHHHTYEDIDRLVAALAHHLPQTLNEEGRTLNDIYRAFRKVVYLKKTNAFITPGSLPVSRYTVQHETAIGNIPEKLWDELMAKNGNFDWKAMQFMEETFKDNLQHEHNWSFHYYLIRDRDDTVVLATFFTLALIKDDMFAPAGVSMKIEHERVTNPYYMCSSCFMMGSLLTEGGHLYIDRSKEDWKEVLMLLLDTVWKEEEQIKADSLSIRDFEAGDAEMTRFLIDQGFIKINLPPTHIIKEMDWDTNEAFAKQFNHHTRQYLRQKVFGFEACFEVSVTSKGTPKQIEYWRKLYENVNDKSFEINDFKLPLKFFENLNVHPNWEIIELYLQPLYDKRTEKKPVAVMFAYKTANRYCPVLVGLDYHFRDTYNTYPQVLWQAILRAKELKLNMINLGLTTSQNKRKFGARPTAHIAFIQLQDHYNASVINAISNTEIIKDYNFLIKEN